MHPRTFPTSFPWKAHTAPLSQAIQTFRSILPFLSSTANSDQAHGNSETFSIPHNLPGIQNTEAIGTLMPLRTLTEASATKPSHFPVTECMTPLGKSLSISLEATRLFSKRTVKGCQWQVNLACQIKTNHKPQNTTQVTPGCSKAVGWHEWLPLPVRWQRKSSPAPRGNTTGLERAIPGGRKRHHSRLGH